MPRAILCSTTCSDGCTPTRSSPLQPLQQNCPLHGGPMMTNLDSREITCGCQVRRHGCPRIYTNACTALEVHLEELQLRMNCAAV